MVQISDDQTELAQYLKGQRQALVKRWIESMKPKGLLGEATEEEAEVGALTLFDVCFEPLETGSYDTILESARKTAEEGLGGEATSEQVMAAMIDLGTVLGRTVFEAYGADPEKWRTMQAICDAWYERVLNITFNALVKDRERVIKLQQQALLELSTPVIRVWERVLTVPLIGTLDSERVRLVMETLLQKVVDTQSRMVILDISGIPRIDTAIANYLIRTVSATRLLGAECIITGVNASIAQTLVELGVDLSGISTRPSMSDGILMAFDLLDLMVVPKQGTPG